MSPSSTKGAFLLAATAFTSWSDLYAAMQNQMADFIANRMQVAEYEFNNGTTVRRFKYRTFKELQEAMTYVKVMADFESGAAVNRTCAANGGGRWE
jgi:hypothetical protein